MDVKLCTLVPGNNQGHRAKDDMKQELNVNFAVYWPLHITHDFITTQTRQKMVNSRIIIGAGTTLQLADLPPCSASIFKKRFYFLHLFERWIYKRGRIGSFICWSFPQRTRTGPGSNQELHLGLPRLARARDLGHFPLLSQVGGWIGSQPAWTQTHPHKGNIAGSSLLHQPQC